MRLDGRVHSCRSVWTNQGSRIIHVFPRKASIDDSRPSWSFVSNDWCVSAPYFVKLCLQCRGTAAFCAQLDICKLHLLEEAKIFKLCHNRLSASPRKLSASNFGKGVDRDLSFCLFPLKFHLFNRCFVLPLVLGRKSLDLGLISDLIRVA